MIISRKPPALKFLFIWPYIIQFMGQAPPPPLPIQGRGTQHPVPLHITNVSWKELTAASVAMRQIRDMSDGMIPFFQLPKEKLFRSTSGTDFIWSQVQTAKMTTFW